MNKRQLCKSIWTALCLMAILVTTAALPVQAAEITDTPGRITVSYIDRNGAPITRLRVRLYQVATATGETNADAAEGYTLSYTLTDAFRTYDAVTGAHPVTGFGEQALNDALTIIPGETDTARRARWQLIAGTLAPYAQADLTPTRMMYTNAQGRVLFDNLQPGLYLLVAGTHLVQENDADYRYTYEPAFVALPQYAGGIWEYGETLVFSDDDVVLRPKYSYDRVTYEYEVYKRWMGDAGVTRPARIQVDIYKDGIYYETVYLEEGNNWRYTWSGGDHEWTVVERTTVDGYSATITAGGKNAAFVITNTYTPPTTPPPTPTPPTPTPPTPTPPPTTTTPPTPEVLGTTRTVTVEDPAVLGAVRRPVEEAPEVLGVRRLPQAGQLWWPVPFMAVFGVILFMTGFIRHRNNR